MYSNFLRIFGITITFITVNPVRAADVFYSFDMALSYLGSPPADGKYQRDKLFFSVKPEGVTPKKLTIFADIVDQSGATVAQISCGVGEVPTGMTIAYPGASCNFFGDGFQVKPGSVLKARMSAAFAQDANTDRPSLSTVIREAVKPFPSAEICAPPQGWPGKLPVGAKGVKVDVFQMAGAIGPDGTLDKTRICVVATAVGGTATGLLIRGGLFARLGKKDHFVGNYACAVRNAPDGLKPGEPFTCPVKDNNDVPATMIVPAGGRLHSVTGIEFSLNSPLFISESPIRYSIPNAGK